MPKPKVRPAVNLRRMYVDCRYGQLHVHSAFPSNGGFDEETTLVALHDSGDTGRSLREFAGELGHDRSVYAPDLPGVGESDPLGRPVALADRAAAVGDFLAQMRFRQVDLFGRGTGAEVAVELALANPKLVRKLVLVDAPAGLLDRLADARPCAELADAGNPVLLARATRDYLNA